MTRKHILIVFLTLTLLLSSCAKATSNKPPETTAPDITWDADPVPDKYPNPPVADNPPVETPEPTPPVVVPPVVDPPKTEVPAPVVPQPVDPMKLSNTEMSWYYTPNSKHQTPAVPSIAKTLLGKYSGYYVGTTTSKVIYLTFDEGYENGYTGKILDILKVNNVKAAFFVTKPYIIQNPELIKRMVNEGHIVGNHTSTHPSMPSKASDINAFKKEFTETETAFKNLTGVKMPMFFRPPMGKYSERSLYLTQSLGYKNIFWSFAHRDWLVDDQPSVETTKSRILNGVHNGEIMLLHAVSKSNTEALDSVIKTLKSQGYRFSSLNEMK